MERIVRDVNCSLEVKNEDNVNCCDIYTTLLDALKGRLKDYIPSELSEGIIESEFDSYINDAVQYGVEALQQSRCEYITVIDDMLNYFYDSLEKEDEDDDLYDIFYRVTASRAEHKMIQSMMEANHMEFDPQSDPMVLAANEAINNAISRGVECERDPLFDDVFNQLSSYINESDLLLYEVDKAINKNIENI